MMFFAFTVMAQKTVTGVVSDDSGIPLPGATIVEQNTSNGVSSDFDGNFTINIAQGASLEISFVGYETLILVTNDADNYNVSLAEGNQLEEVIVTTALGLTTTKRSFMQPKQ